MSENGGRVILVFRKAPESMYLRQQLFHPPVSFAIFQAVGIIYSHISCFIHFCKNNKMSCVGKVTGIHGTNDGMPLGELTGYIGGRCLTALGDKPKRSSAFCHQRPGCSLSRHVIAGIFGKHADSIRIPIGISSEAADHHGKAGRSAAIYCEKIVSICAVPPTFIPL